MTLLDTSVLVAYLAEGGEGPRALLRRLGGERAGLLSLVLYEWRRGPRTTAEIEIQEALFPSAMAIPFGPIEAGIAAVLYRRLRRPRSREVDIAIAASAIHLGAALWTLNPADFADVPGLRLAAASG